MRIRKRQRVGEVVPHEMHALVLQREGLGVDVDAMDVAVAALEQLARERALPRRDVEDPAGRGAFEEAQQRRVVALGGHDLQVVVARAHPSSLTKSAATRSGVKHFAISRERPGHAARSSGERSAATTASRSAGTSPAGTTRPAP